MGKKRTREVPESPEPAVCPSDEPLIRLGQLYTGVVQHRPSKVIKTPYVADVLMDGGDVTQVHTPSLDSAGMVVPGRSVYMTATATGSKAKTSHAVQLATEPRESGKPDAVVGVHPKLAELIAEQMIHRRLVPEFGAPSTVLKEQTRGQTRVDFVLQYDDGRELLVEVKNCSGADYPTGDVPEHRSHIGVYTTDREPFRRAAIFPHGTCHKPKIRVVSARAIKQVNELIKFQEDDSEEHEHVSSAVLVIVNRGDCELFRPCHEACGLFAAMLRRAYARGVLVLAYCVDWDPVTGVCEMGRKLPVSFEQAEDESVDDDWLADVLSAEIAMAGNKGDMPKDWKPQSEFLTTRIPKNFKPPAMRPKPKPRPKKEVEEVVHVKLQPRKPQRARSKGRRKVPASDTADGAGASEEAPVVEEEPGVKVSMKVKTVRKAPTPSNKLPDSMTVEDSTMLDAAPETETLEPSGSASAAQLAGEAAATDTVGDQTPAVLDDHGEQENVAAAPVIAAPAEEQLKTRGLQPRKRDKKSQLDQRDPSTVQNETAGAALEEASADGQTPKKRRVRRAHA